MKILVKVMLLVWGSLIVGSGYVLGDTILFPYIASDGVNVTTIVTIVNKAGDASHLNFIYRYKTASSSLSASCNTTSFTRSTHQNDLLTFDVAGIFEGGRDMYNDPDSYGGTFNISESSPIRGYLVVTHSNSSGIRINVSNSDIAYSDESLYGEAVLLDITSGAAWGYRAQNKNGTQSYDLEIPSYHLTTERVSGGVYSSSEGVTLPFFPTSIWTTRLFITPTGPNMDNTDYYAKLKLVTSKDPSQPRINDSSSCSGGPCDETEGFFTRAGIAIGRSGSGAQTVNCVGMIPVTSFLDSTQRSFAENAGGWGILYADYLSGGADYVNVYKLEYVLNNATYGGTNNNAILLSEEEVF